MTLVADFNPNVSVPFSRLRQLFEDSSVQAGVVGSTDLKVAQRGAGANMSVDVPAGQAWVEVTTGTRNGLAHIVNDAIANVAVTASHATLPRIDQVVLQYNDSQIPTGSGDVPTLAMLTGTATSGATLDNRTGAAALGNDRLRLADILVPAATTSVTTVNIRDRRPWSRGVFFRGVRTAGAVTTTSASFSCPDTNAFNPRIECSGALLRLRFIAVVSHSSTTSFIQGGLNQDGVGIDGTAGLAQVSPTTTLGQTLIIDYTAAPTAGSHTFAAMWLTGAATATMQATAAQPAVMTIEEIVRPNTSNT